MNRHRHFKYLMSLLVGLALCCGAASTGATTALEVQPSAVDDRQVETGPVQGLDFLQFWLIPRAANSVEQISVYERDDHEQVIAFGKQLARDSDSPRFAALLTKTEQLYESGLEPTATPFFYSVFGMLQSENFDRDYWVYQTVSNLSFVLAVLLLGHMVGIGFWINLMLAALVFAIFRPWSFDFGVANTNRIQLLLFAVSVVMSRKSGALGGLGALVMGMAIAFKPNLILVPMFIGLGYFRERQQGGRRYLWLIIGVLIGFAIGCGLGAFWFGSLHVWLDWREFLGAVLSSPYPMESGNYSLVGLFPESWRPQLPGLFVMICGLVSLGVLACSPQPTKTVSPRDGMELWLRLGALGLLCGLLSAPLVWSHYYLLAVPSILLLIPVWKSPPGTPIGTMFFRGSILLGSLLAAGVPLVLLNLSDPIVVTVTMQAGVVLLFCSVLYSILTRQTKSAVSRSA